MRLALVPFIVLLLSSAPAQAVLGSKSATGTLNNTADHFLPIEAAYQPRARLVGNDTLRVRWEIADGYYLYRHPFAAHAGETLLAITLPAGQAIHDEYFGDVEVYYDRAEVSIHLPDSYQGPINLTYQGCADAGLCYPPDTYQWAVDLSRRHVDNGHRVTAPPPPATAPIDSPGWLAAVGLAFLGGLILNLMPCVFPVLGLKALSLARTPPRQRLWHGLLYALGVISSFLIVAALLMAVRQAGAAVGWGFQLQSPWFVGALAYLFTLIGLALLGWFTPGLRWMGLGHSWTEGHGPTHSFATGVLAVVVASPCTAPFMATALGVALTRPLPITLAVFSGLGVGMAAPFLLLTALPGAGRWLPRPGPWMRTLQRWLSLPIFLTVLWLLWVVARQSGHAGLLTVLGGGALLVLACRWPRLRLARAATVALALALLALPTLAPRSDTPVAEGDWLPYSESRLTALRQSGQAVFLNVTADWCLTCLANEAAVLNRPAVRKRLAAHDVVLMKADWTHRNAAIATLLARHGRSGVPLYVFYPPDPSQPGRVLPQLLRERTIDRALDAIPEK